MNKILFCIIIIITFIASSSVASYTTYNDFQITKNRPLTQERVVSLDLPTFVKENGFRVSWSHATDQIAFDQVGSDGYYDIFLMNPDGTNETCLIDSSDLSPGHKGCATWHPSGEYIVFTYQKNKYFGKNIPIMKTWLDKLATPGEGLNCDLWVMTADGLHVWPLTSLPTKTWLLDKQPYTGVLHPHFSHDGTKLLWSERVGSADNKWGAWTLNIADFHISNGQPELMNITIFTPGETPCFYESHGFSPDDTTIIFSGNLIENQDENHLDIYTMNITTQTLSRLTTEESEWDEHAHFTSDGSKIVWMSSHGFEMNTQRNWWDYLKTEYWIMQVDGSQKTQLSFYNNDTLEEYQIICSDCSFNVDGTQLAATVLCKNANASIGGIIILDFPQLFNIGEEDL